jgi:hypothetical protein
VDPKMIFVKNQELVLLELKGKLTPVPAKLVGACAKSRNNFEGLRDETGVDMCISGGLLFMWGVVPSFPFAISVAPSQENPILTL